MRIAISGKARSGKDTTGGVIMRLAEPIYNITTFIQQTLNLPIEKNPAMLQHIGKMRDLGIIHEDTYIDLLISKLPTDTNVFIADVRYKNELAKLKANGFMTVRIERQNRPIDRDITAKSEIDLDDATFDYMFMNDGTIQQLWDTLDGLSKNENPYGKNKQDD
jgi:hypothetical protein